MPRLHFPDSHYLALSQREIEYIKAMCPSFPRRLRNGTTFPDWKRLFESYQSTWSTPTLPNSADGLACFKKRMKYNWANSDAWRKAREAAELRWGSDHQKNTQSLDMLARIASCPTAAQVEAPLAAPLAAPPVAAPQASPMDAPLFSTLAHSLAAAPPDTPPAVCQAAVQAAVQGAAASQSVFNAPSEDNTVDLSARELDAKARQLTDQEHQLSAREQELDAKARQLRDQEQQLSARGEQELDAAKALRDRQGELSTSENGLKRKLNQMAKGGTTTTHSGKENVLLSPECLQKWKRVRVGSKLSFKGHIITVLKKTKTKCLVVQSDESKVRSGLTFRLHHEDIELLDAPRRRFRR